MSAMNAYWMNKNGETNVASSFAEFEEWQSENGDDAIYGYSYANGWYESHQVLSNDMVYCYEFDGAIKFNNPLSLSESGVAMHLNEDFDGKPCNWNEAAKNSPLFNEAA